MISVCMATYNGEKYLEDQIKSILGQLGDLDELIVSDDGSTDNTLRILDSYSSKDSRVRVVHGPSNGLISNFENALSFAKGEYVFLSDQDDVWVDSKVRNTMNVLKRSVMVISDCTVTDDKLNTLASSFYRLNGSRNGVLKNLYKNSYLGCCMAFRRELLDLALPLPKNIPMHDWWFGMVAEQHFNVTFIEDNLVKYRRHGNNASITSEVSRNSLLTKIKYRYNLVSNLLKLKRV